MRVGQARKRDSNEKAIVEALQAFGAEVMRISGEGLPDLFVCYRGRWTPLEVKSATGHLTPLQAIRALNGRNQIPVVHSVDEALQALGAGGRGTGRDDPARDRLVARAEEWLKTHDGYFETTAEESAADLLRDLLAVLTGQTRPQEQEQFTDDGQWICETCGFTLMKAILRASDGAVGVDRSEVQDICPNDGTSLRRLTWKEDAANANRVAREQMERADKAEAALAGVQQQPVLTFPRWRCRQCGCLWRDNLDGTVSLFDAHQQSCQHCEMTSTTSACEIEWFKSHAEPVAAPQQLEAENVRLRQALAGVSRQREALDVVLQTMHDFVARKPGGQQTRTKSTKEIVEHFAYELAAALRAAQTGEDR